MGMWLDGYDRSHTVIMESQPEIVLSRVSYWFVTSSEHYYGKKREYNSQLEKC